MKTQSLAFDIESGIKKCMEDEMSYIDRETKLIEITDNFVFFESVLDDLLDSHAGEYVIIRQKEIVSFCDSIVDAQSEASAKFPDGLFSVQKVANDPVNLGHYAYVFDDR